METPQEKLKTALPNAKPKVLEKDKVANQEPQLQGVQAPEAPIPQAPEAQKMEVQTQEPKLFGEATQERRPQEVQTQEPILFSETPQAPEVQKVQPTPPKAEKVRTPEEIKQAELVNKKTELDLSVQEKSVSDQEKQSKINEFTGLVQGGADTNTLADYARNNPTLGKDFHNILKNHFKTSDNAKFFSKYSAMSAENVAKAVKIGDVRLYDEKYNLLPPQQRAEVERIVKMQDAQNAMQKTDFKSPEYNMDMGFDTLMSKMFSSNTAQKIENMRNDNRLVPLTQQLNRKQAEIEALDVSMIGMQERIEREQAGRISNSSIRAMIRDEQQAMQLEKIALLSEYRIIQGDIASVQADIDRDIRLLEYEDAQEKQKYAMMYDEYKTRRGEMLARTTRAEDRDFQVAMAEFEVMNRELAEKRQQDFQKEILAINQKFTLENKEPKYMTDRNGNLIAIVDGQAQNVMGADGQVVAITREQDYTDTVSFNGDMGQYVTTRTYKDGRLPDFFVNDINGNSNVSLGAFNVIAQIPAEDLWCGQATNMYVKKAGLTKTNGEPIHVGDSYESKKKHINNMSPQVGGLAVWNPEPEGKFGENGHIGIVTGMNERTGMVQITDWNAKGDKKKSTYEVPISQIVNSDGGFVHLQAPQPEGQEAMTSNFGTAQEKFLQSISIQDIEKNRKSMEELGLTAEDVYAYKANNLDVETKRQYESVKQALQNLRGPDGRFETAPGFGGAVGIAKTKLPFSENLLPGTKAADYKNNADFLLNALLLPNLSLMTGVLTDRDIEVLRRASANINTETSSEAGFLQGLKDIEMLANKVLGIQPQEDIQPTQPLTRQTTGTLMTDFDQFISLQDMNNIINR